MRSMWKVQLLVLSLSLASLAFSAAAQDTSEPPVKFDSNLVIQNAGDSMLRCNSLPGCLNCLLWKAQLFCTSCDEASGYQLMSQTLQCGCSTGYGSYIGRASAAAAASTSSPVQVAYTAPQACPAATSTNVRALVQAAESEAATVVMSASGEVGGDGSAAAAAAVPKALLDALEAAEKQEEKDRRAARTPAGLRRLLSGRGQRSSSRFSRRRLAQDPSPSSPPEPEKPQETPGSNSSEPDTPPVLVNPIPIDGGPGPFTGQPPINDTEGNPLMLPLMGGPRPMPGLPAPGDPAPINEPLPLFNHSEPLDGGPPMPLPIQSDPVPINDTVFLLNGSDPSEGGPPRPMPLEPAPVPIDGAPLEPPAKEGDNISFVPISTPLQPDGSEGPPPPIMYFTGAPVPGPPPPMVISPNPNTFTGTCSCWLCPAGTRSYPSAQGVGTATCLPVETVRSVVKLRVVVSKPCSRRGNGAFRAAVREYLKDEGAAARSLTSKCRRADYVPAAREEYVYTLDVRINGYEDTALLLVEDLTDDPCNLSANICDGQVFTEDDIIIASGVVIDPGQSSGTIPPPTTTPSPPAANQPTPQPPPSSPTGTIPPPVSPPSAQSPSPPVATISPPSPVLVSSPPASNTPPVASPPVGSPPDGSPPVSSPPTASPPAGATPLSPPPVASPPGGTTPVASPPVGSPPTGSPPVASPPAVGSLPVTSPPSGSPPVGSPPIGSPPVGSPPAMANAPPPPSTVPGEVLETPPSPPPTSTAPTTSPPPQTSSPPPVVSSPPPSASSPPPMVSSPPPQISSPPPQVSSPPPAVSSPPPAVASPPPAVSSPPPAVASPPPSAITTRPPPPAPFDGFADSGPFARLECNDLDQESENFLTKSLLVYAMEELKATSGPLGFEQIAAVNGRLDNYEGFNSPGGFAKRQQIQFAPWHRAYVWHLENALFPAAQRAALKFTDPRIRDQMLNVESFNMKLCYWDWTLGSSNAFVSASQQVRVLPLTASTTNASTSVPNPFRGFQGLSGTYSSILPTTRDPDFLNTGLDGEYFYPWVVNFLTSGNKTCTYMSNTSCAGNLEDIQAWVHNDIGGTMNNITVSSFDPIYFLHYAYVDFLLWCWQTNFPAAGQSVFNATATYPPFKNDTSSTAALTWQDIADPENLNYYYEQSSTSGIWHDQEDGQNNKRRSLLAVPSQLEQQQQQWLRNRRHLQEQAADSQGSSNFVAPVAVGRSLKADAAPPADSPPGPSDQDVLRNYMARLQSKYSGYMHQLRLSNVDCKAAGSPYVIMAFLKPKEEVQAGGNWRSLLQQESYCSAWSGATCGGPGAPEIGTVSVTLDLTICMKRNGINPDSPPLNPADPTAGPAKVPITLDDIQVRAFRLDTSEDVGAVVGLGSLAKSLTWTKVFSQADSNKNAGRDGLAVAAASSSELYTVNIHTGDDGVPRVGRAPEQPAVFGLAGNVVEYQGRNGRRKRLL